MSEKIAGVLRQLYRSSPALAVTGWIHWILTAVMMALLLFDKRAILGINPWIKPMKFSISIAIYVWTLAWYLQYIEGRRRAVMIISWGASISVLAEMFFITLQSARGVQSHFNVAMPLDAAIFSVMGAMIGINTVMVCWTLVLFFSTHPDLPAGYLCGIRFGLFVFLLASFEGVLMVVHGSHTVGAADGGAGLPFVNWSREHGDLRVMHFLGMHALQILPLGGYCLGRLLESRRAQIAGTLALFVLYVAGMAWFFNAAWHGLPVLSF